jgi:hypothetical protein
MLSRGENARLWNRFRPTTARALVTLAAFSWMSVQIAPRVNASVIDNLAGYYMMDETDTLDATALNSAAGATENGVRSSSVTIGQPAAIDKGYSFVGQTTAGYVALGTSIANGLTATDKITIAAWINPSYLNPGTTAGSRQTMLGGNADITFALYNTGNLLFNYKNNSTTDNTKNSGGANNLAGGMTVPLNQWSHVAVTRDGTSIAMYINGVLVSQQTGNAGNFYLRTFDYDFNAATADDRGLYAGAAWASATSTTRFYAGVMDELGIWSGAALTPQQIAVIAGFGDFAEVPLTGSAIDDVLDVFAAQSGVASAGGYDWFYTASVPAAADASTLYSGKHYVGTDGNRYILLGGTTGSFTGVATPEPALAGLLALAAIAMRRRAGN